MQISEREQVTITQEYRIQFGFLPHTEVEFIVRNNELVLVRKRGTQSQVQFDDWLLTGEDAIVLQCNTRAENYVHHHPKRTS